MEKILYLVHRIPYPPNKGDKIRSYHFLKELAKHYQVFLGTFIDDADDLQYQDALSDYCEQQCCLALNPQWSKLKSLSGLLTGEALSLPYYRSQTMQQWVDRILAEHDIDKVVVFSSVMAQFVMDKPDLHMIVDFVDVDSDKWRQYATTKHWPASLIYQREARTLLAFERQVARRSKSSFFVSEQEAGLFKQLAPECADKVDWVNNGVDIDFFDPDKIQSSPYAETEQVVVFTGAMDYWPNIDAVVWFAENVFPTVHKQCPQARFYIVGSKPAKAVLALAEKQAGVVVTGRVEDVRPFLKYARAAVAPLRVARGIQNKVLEAMAMKKPVIATSAAMEGIEGFESLDVLLENAETRMATGLAEWLQKTGQASEINRHFVATNFSWASSGQKFIEQIEG